ncbi:major facilitator superfamily domain-containing protein [Talaromyces proteolyticus]|uniref:Major facilitator superfamily domain-containing protein n=1 Tax=Talaromyces proteolyticus TaxID=1131652 RepID=A0AAD4PTX6_9EURO|nr:major facilitator superfamily domain-containing protein [Talaromyces proteolyticus]KAH8689446.1 major facilitator superfamily domain-containing protein [Talaromyces proteolyticus]
MLLGLTPLFWAPLAERYGRRPVWLVSTFLSMVANIGCARSTSYGTLMVARVFQPVFNAPAGALGTAVVVELFFARERGFKIGIWTLMVTLGNPVGPLVMGFVATRVGCRWIFWIFSATNGVQFLGYLFFSPETKYVRRTSNNGVVAAPKHTFRKKYLSFEKIPDSMPVKVSQFFVPLRLLARLSVSISTLAHSVIFGFCSVLICVEIPALLGVKFGLNAEQIGLNFIGNIIGGVIGEQLSGPFSDYIRNRRLRSNPHHQTPVPENRLWFAYPAYILCIVGFVVFLVTLDNATPNQWTVAPVIGLAICAAGNQMQTTSLFTYAVDRNLVDSGGVGVSIILVRQIWSFIGPFWFPYMFGSIGLRGSAALCSALMVIFAILPTALQQFYLGPRKYKMENH